MPYSMMLDSGHGGSDPGAVYRGRREKDDTLRLTLAVGEILQENGIEVLYTRTTAVSYTHLVWSIGVNGTPASADYAEKMHKVIKACLREIFGDVADEIPVLYGGSVNPGNANELIVQPSIDGLFTGRAAWQADNFDKLIRDAKATYEAK